MKRGTPRHPKTYALAEVLSVPLYAAVGILEMLWHHTAQYTPRGNIGSLPDAAIAEGCGFSRRPEILIQALIETGWLDRHDEHRLIVHDWHEHADNAVIKKLGRGGKDFIVGPVKQIGSVIYFIQGETSKLIKIGFTEGSPEVRKDLLQTGSPETLILLGSRTGTRADEKRLHASFSHLRVNGEWFRPEPDLMACVNGDNSADNGSRSADNGGQCQPSREAMAKAEAFVVSSSEEIKSEIPKPETAIAVLEHPTPLEILDELRPIYHRAGLPIAPKHEQLAIQALIDIPATKRHRLVDYVKNALLTGRWRGTNTTKGLLNLLRDGDWDVPIVERTLPAAPVVDERIQRLRERRHHAAKS